MLDPAVWETVSDWAVALTAVVGVGFGLSQLGGIRRANHYTAQFERAKLLLEFDRDFEGEALVRARQRTLVVRNRIEQEVSKLEPPLSAERQRHEIARRFSEHMTIVWRRSRTFDGDADAARDSASEDYMTLMRLPYWCETLGHQCRRNLLPLEDVLELYDQLIIFVMGNIIDHVQLRSEHGPHHNARYLEHARWLFDRAVEHKKEAIRTVPAPLNRAKIDWKG